MRVMSVVLAAVVLSGCLKQVRPEGPVLSSWERSREWGIVKPSLAQYAGQPQTAAPILPFMAFGASYDVDLVIRSKHPKWDMHEFAMMPSRTGPLWLMKGARANSLDQILHVDVEDPDLLWPELPLTRKKVTLKIDDGSTAEEGIDIRFELEDIDGDLIKAEFKGEAPGEPMRKRNGNTMGHSANQALVALDVSQRESTFLAKLEVEGRKYKAEKIGGLVPFQFTLAQTQGGLVVGSYAQTITGIVSWPSAGLVKPPPRVVFDPMTDDAGALPAGGALPELSDDLPEGETEAEPEADAAVDTKGDGAAKPAAPGTDGGKRVLADAADGEADGTDELADDPVAGMPEGPAFPAGPPLAIFETVHDMASGKKVAQGWTIDHRGTEVVVRTEDDQRGLQYFFLVNGESLELYRITTTQYGRPTPTVAISFNPALPDLRRPFNNRVTSRYVIDVNGQQNHAIGAVQVTSLATGGGTLKVTPEAPFWTADRPLTSTVNIIDGQPVITVQRTN